MAWAGTGLLWTLSGGIAGGALLPDAAAASQPGRSAGLNFVQISDSHIGFDRAANPDPAATLRATVAQIQALAVPPAFVVHTGDISHLSQDRGVRRRSPDPERTQHAGPLHPRRT